MLVCCAYKKNLARRILTLKHSSPVRLPESPMPLFQSYRKVQLGLHVLALTFQSENAKLLSLRFAVVW